MISDPTPPAFDPDRLCALIVNWNLRDDTVECIESLLRSGFGPGKIIVVDNGSTDGSPETIRARFHDRIRLVRSPENLGYAAGVNLGIAQALQLGAQWLFLLNNDAVVDERFRAVLTHHLEQAGGGVLFGPAIFYYFARDRIWFLGDRLVPGTLFTYSLYRNRELPEDLPATIPVDFLNGCGMAVPMALFEEIGGFDTSLVMYGEEVDFCWRARSAGYRFLSVPRARMWHKVSASSRKDSAKMQFLRMRNQTWFYRRSSRGLRLAAMFAGSLVRALWMTLRLAVSGAGRLAAALWRGWWAGWGGPVPERSLAIGFEPGEDLAAGGTVPRRTEHE